MNKVDYEAKMNEMIDSGMENGTYIESEDSTLKDLKTFKEFFVGTFNINRVIKKCYPLRIDQ